MLVEIPPKMSVSSFVGFLKGKSSLMIHERHGNLEYKYGNRSFWCKGYYECYIFNVVNLVSKKALKHSFSAVMEAHIARYFAG